MQSMTALIENEYDYTRPQRGKVYEVTILSIGQHDVIVDLGAKRDGIVPPKDLDLLDKEYRAGLKVGDRVPIVVMRSGSLLDGLVVSINKGLQQQDWLRAQELLESGKAFEVEVTDFNRGGVIAPFGRLRGFVPNSHLDSLPQNLRGKRLQEAKSELVGQTLTVAVVEINQRKRRLVLSERVANRCRRRQLFEELSKGDVRQGIVCNLVDFGAFVDLGGADGLVHISELSWKHINHPREVLSVGDEIEVYVLNIDRERERIGLSRKRLLPDPWYPVTEDMHPGDVVEGTVTNVVDFGAFVDVGEGIEGLVHVSKMPDGDATCAGLEPDTPVTVSVLEINDRKHQIALRLQEMDLSSEA